MSLLQGQGPTHGMETPERTPAPLQRSSSSPTWLGLTLKQCSEGSRFSFKIQSQRTFAAPHGEAGEGLATCGALGLDDTTMAPRSNLKSESRRPAAPRSYLEAEDLLLLLLRNQPLVSWTPFTANHGATQVSPFALPHSLGGLRFGLGSRLRGPRPA